MADKKLSVDQLYGRAITARKEAEDKLKGTAGRGGLEAGWLRAQEYYAKRNDPGVFTKQVIEEYNLTKAAYEEWSKKYQDALAAETKYKAQVDAAAKDADKAKVAKDAADKLEKAKAEKARADSLIPSRGQGQADTAAQAVANAQSALDTAQQAASNKPLLKINNLSGINFNNYTVAPQGGVNDASGNQVMFVSTKTADGKVTTTPFTQANGGSDAAVAELLKNYSTPEALKSFQQELINKHYSNSANLQNGQWKNDVKKLINDYSSRFIADGQSTPNAIAMSTVEFFTKASSLGGAGTPTQYKTITTRGDAKKELDQYLIDLRGSASTPQEENAYYTQLHAAEQKAIRTVSGGTTTGSELAQTDHVLLAATVAKKSLAGTDVDKLLQSGGRAATDIAALQQYASSYGVQMSAADALKYVAAGLGQQDYLKKQEERIKQTSIVLHPQLKDHILAGGTVQDIADQYAYAKKQKLGVAVPVSTTDKDVMDALSKGISISDFNRALQAKPEWRTTDEAHTVANNYAQKILSSFGFGG
jgi:hypothetical protein